MARTRQVRRQNSKESKRNSQRISHEDKLAHLSKFKVIADPTNKRSVTRQYNELKRVPLYLQREVKDKETIKEMKKHGFFTTEKGIIVDGPRNAKREPIRGAKVKVSKSGTVTWSIKQRRDIIYGFTRAEKKEFARDPKGFTKKKVEELKRTHPSMRNSKKPPQIRLQWGAYQAQKDFAPQAFEKMTSFQQFRAMHGEGRKRRKADEDRLTGLHIVIHVPRKKKK